MKVEDLIKIVKKLAVFLVALFILITSESIYALDNVSNDEMYTDHYLVLNSLRAVLTPKFDITLSSKSVGLVTKCYRKEGEYVKKGDVILEIDSRLEKLQLELAKEQENSARIQYEKAQLDFERIEKLHKEKIHSDKKCEDAKYECLLAEMNYKLKQKQTEIAKVALEDCFVRAPIDGVFFKKIKNEGELVARYEIVGRVIDYTSVQATFYCDFKEFNHIQKDNIYEVYLLNGEKVSLDTTYIDPIIDPISGTFRICIETKQSDTLYPGLPVFLKINNKS